LYYTDCRPGQGLQGGAGFQFQAASPGIAPEAMPLVQRSALYEPPVRWMRERRSLADYPPSLAHTADGDLFATAAGCYLGQEVNGTREGNQFTHAVVTRDPADYGLVRPAQLWGAPWWAAGPAPATALEDLAVHPEPGPLDVETVRDRVRAAADGEARLTALLSAIHHLADPERRRTVVLVSADPEAAACWIAAATLLLPAPDALRVSFKIFVADGQYGQHDIIALHPEWAGRWADTGSGSGLAVFDLDRGEHTAVAATAAAGFWVPRLLAEDPYDVVDAVELAGQFARARAGDAGVPRGASMPSSADRLAAVVVAAGERVTAPGCLEQTADWLLTAPEDAMRIARDPVLAAVLDAAERAAVLDAAGPAPVLRTLAAAAAARGWVSAAVRIRRGLRSAEIGEALAASDGVAALRMLTALTPLPPLDRPQDDAEHGRAEIEQALSGARPDQVAPLLTVARRHSLTPVTSAFRGAANEFAQWWVRQRDPVLAPEHWHPPPEALDWVRDVLRGALAGPRRPYAEEALRTCWWRALWPEACDPTDELDRQLMSLACQHLEGAQRDQLMRDVQQWTFARMASAAPPSTGACDTVVWDSGTWDTVAWDTVSWDTVAWDIVFGARTPGITEATIFSAGLVNRGRTLSTEVGSKLWAVLEKEPRDTALAFVGGCSELLATPIYDALTGSWPRLAGAATAQECRAVAFSFVLATFGATSKTTGDPMTDQRRVLLERLAELVAAMPKDVRAAVDRSYPGGLGKPWRDWVSQVDVSQLDVSQPRPGRLRLRRRSRTRPDPQPGRGGG
ncbi:MAG: hypothetical protein ACRDS0_21530, partial [Pseudonocardiaceae bacterium]